jgi:hypothetical protein
MSHAQLDGELTLDGDAYAAQGAARNTQRAYQSDWADFKAWCMRTACPRCPQRRVQ